MNQLEEKPGFLIANCDLQLDDSLGEHEVVIYHLDGVQWRGDWLLGHMRIWAAAQLHGIRESLATKINLIHAGTIAFNELNGISIAIPAKRFIERNDALPSGADSTSGVE